MSRSAQMRINHHQSKFSGAIVKKLTSLLSVRATEHCKLWKVDHLHLRSSIASVIFSPTLHTLGSPDLEIYVKSGAILSDLGNKFGSHGPIERRYHQANGTGIKGASITSCSLPTW